MRYFRTRVDLARWPGSSSPDLKYHQKQLLYTKRHKVMSSRNWLMSFRCYPSSKSDKCHRVISSVKSLTMLSAYRIYFCLQIIRVEDDFILRMLFGEWCIGVTDHILPDRRKRRLDHIEIAKDKNIRSHFDACQSLLAYQRYSYIAGVILLNLRYVYCYRPLLTPSQLLKLSFPPSQFLIYCLWISGYSD